MINTKLYIQFDDTGSSIDHPMMFESAQTKVGFILNQQSSTITEQDVLNNNFALIEDTMLRVDEHVIGQEGYKRLPNGNFTRNYIVKILTQEEKLDKWVRGRRDLALFNTDWTQLADNDLTDEERVKWLAYRKQLRDLTKTYANIEHPDEVIMPAAPRRRPLPVL